MTEELLRNVQVKTIGIEADGIISVVLEDPNGDELPEWQPGAHLDVITASGLERQYSLCGDPRDHRVWRIAVLNEPQSRGGSRWIHSGLKEGDSLAVKGPRNHFALRPAREYVFIAGGIGITPILTMIAQAEADGTEWRLVYGGRERSSMAFTEELKQYGDKVTFWPQDEHGLIDLDSLLSEPRDQALVYVCGPEPLLKATEEQCLTWPDGALNLERFAPKPGAFDGPKSSFEIELDHSGLTLTVGPEQSIVDAVGEVGVPVQVSCLEGTCGTCETEVLEGTPDHRDSFLTAQEQAQNDTMMICCSRAKTSKLVLDI